MHTAEQNKRFGSSAVLEPDWLRLMKVVTTMPTQTRSGRTEYHGQCCKQSCRTWCVVRTILSISG